MRNAIALQFCGGLAAVVLSLPALAQDAHEGRRLFERYCATCHGLAGDGMGPMRPVLIVQPSDLTGLMAGNDGAFPLARVIARIDGRDPLVAHGSDMPVYGGFLEGGQVEITAPGAAPQRSSARVADLVAYLVALQAR